jgi:hypothetical protein
LPLKKETEKATRYSVTSAAPGFGMVRRLTTLTGYARRYFILRNNGSLCYSFGQGEEVRDQIHLNNAAFSSSPNDRYIHVDSGTATFHLRALTRSDYEEWMAALRYVALWKHPICILNPLKEVYFYASSRGYSRCRYPTFSQLCSYRQFFYRSCYQDERYSRRHVKGMQHMASRV